MKILKFTVRIVQVVTVFTILLGVWIGIQQMTGNFHEVIPGELYRSAQPDPDDIAEFHHRHGIRSVINLRDDISAAQLAEEKAAVETAGMKFYHFPFSSEKQLPVSDIHKLVELMRQAPEPILVHCNHGANRTGLAAAVYLAEIARRERTAAGWQLSPFYGHLPIPFIGRYAMTESWKAYSKASEF